MPRHFIALKMQKAHPEPPGDAEEKLHPWRMCKERGDA